MIGRGAFLIKGLPFGAFDKTLEDDGTIAYSRQRTGCHLKVVLDQIKFRDFSLFREIKLVRMSDPDFSSADVQHFYRVVRFHQAKANTVRNARERCRGLQSLAI